LGFRTPDPLTQISRPFPVRMVHEMTDTKKKVKKQEDNQKERVVSSDDADKLMLKATLAQEVATVQTTMTSPTEEVNVVDALLEEADQSIPDLASDDDSDSQGDDDVDDDNIMEQEEETDSNTTFIAEESDDEREDFKEQDFQQSGVRMRKDLLSQISSEESTTPSDSNVEDAEELENDESGPEKKTKFQNYGSTTTSEIIPESSRVKVQEIILGADEIKEGSKEIVDRSNVPISDRLSTHVKAKYYKDIKHYKITKKDMEILEKELSKMTDPEVEKVKGWYTDALMHATEVPKELKCNMILRYFIKDLTALEFARQSSLITSSINSLRWKGRLVKTGPLAPEPLMMDELSAQVLNMQLIADASLSSYEQMMEAMSSIMLDMKSDYRVPKLELEQKMEQIDKSISSHRATIAAATRAFQAACERFTQLPTDDMMKEVTKSISNKSHSIPSISGASGRQVVEEPIPDPVPQPKPLISIPVNKEHLNVQANMKALASKKLATLAALSKASKK